MPYCKAMLKKLHPGSRSNLGSQIDPREISGTARGPALEAWLQH